ncbi:hypothetical protein [Microcoleus sp. herbarium12]|uniref:hypothetical protein n=1 Tax=Microcoleus sp. herbarium12 TaxID=3055437 RepID=UPI002FD16655
MTGDPLGGIDVRIASGLANGLAIALKGSGHHLLISWKNLAEIVYPVNKIGINFECANNKNV